MAAETYQALAVGDGCNIDYTPAGAVVAGEVVLPTASGIFGVATQPIAAGELGSLKTRGIFKVLKIDEATAAGKYTYWDTAGTPNQAAGGATGASTLTGAEEGFIGCIADLTAHVQDTDDFAYVAWSGPRGLANTIHQMTTYLYTDPADAGTLTVTRSGTWEIVGAGADTRVLSDPPFVGCILVIVYAVDVTSATVSCANGFDSAGSVSALFTHAGETITLIGVKQGANLRWATMFADGPTMS